MYIDSSGKEYVIAEMPLIMVFNVVIKHGKKALIEQGYQELVDIFDKVYTLLEIRSLLNNLQKEGI
jgi:hypothetical protein